ncbi:hypothetical protein GGX14DRAFT_580794 [Mycena pura]|uniref:Uncharacterized protein n=1 Tax=Mycena pura TaxID=153505 RepID=A0AAD6US43_9AGAR|nr:hypothetical protein GGX14DRAFT_580794 [Mycena pura]
MSSLLERSRQRDAQRLQQRTQDSAPSSPSPFIQSLPGLDIRRDLETPPPVPHALVQRPLSTMQIKRFGERLLGRIKLTEENAAELLRFCETASPEERTVLQFAHTLLVEDQILEMQEHRAQNWSMTSTQKDAAKEYTRAILLLPNTQFYSGSVEATIITAMRANKKITGLPSEDGPDAKTLKQAIGRILSQEKNIKDSTTTTDVAAQNIAVLAESALSMSTHVKPTLGLYYRLAFIRTHVRKNHSDHRFWAEVDAELEILHDAGPTEFVSAMDTNLEDDMELFGHYTKSTVKHHLGSVITSSTPAWLKKLYDLAPRIQRISTSSKTRGVKRRRIQVAEPENDGEGEGAGEGDDNADEGEVEGGGRDGNEGGGEGGMDVESL